LQNICNAFRKGIKVERGCHRDLSQICACTDMHLFYLNFMLLLWKRKNVRGCGGVGWGQLAPQAPMKAFVIPRDKISLNRFLKARLIPVRNTTYFKLVLCMCMCVCA
jgi:hypothetical protein